jgi:hypothetical protein
MNTMTKSNLVLLLICFVAVVTLGAATERTIYSQTSNKELKQKAIQVVKNVRGLVESYEKKERELRSEYDRKDSSDMNRGTADASRKQWLKESDLLHESTMRYYKEHYWADAILLVQELSKRQPKKAKESEPFELYQYPTNVLGLTAIANHLELTAKSLPDG